MSDSNPTDLFAKNTIFNLSKLPSGQTNPPITPNLFNIQPSEPQANPLTTSNPKNDTSKNGNLNEQQKKGKQLRSDQASNKNKKQEGGGILRKGGKNQQQTQNLAIDTTLHFGLQDIIESIVKGQKLDKRQVGKIVTNFKMYVRDSTQSFKVDTICQEIKANQEVKEKILKLPYLNQIEEKSKKAINMFWVTMIENIKKKVPFLSQNCCLQIIKLEISMNKHNYCQKQNLGTFDVKLFTDPHLFPIINNKVQINTQHKTYLTIQNRIIHMMHNQFKSLKAIFKQMSYLKFNQNDKYLKVFEIFQENTDSKKKVVDNLFKSFFQMIKLTPQSQLNSNISYFECVAQSIWDFYSGNQNAFSAEECTTFLNKLNQNYTFFNQSGRMVSLNLNKLLSVVEKISINFLLYFPFTYNNWQNQNLKDIILKSHLEMLEPFKMLLPQNKREGLRINITHFETSGKHWKQFIEIMIKIQQDDDERVDYILESMRVFFRENYEDFWENPQKYESFYRFTSDVLSRKSEQFEEREAIRRFLSILGIGSELMGLEKQRESNSGEFGVGYPQRKIRPYGLEVHNQFSHYFMRMSPTQFMEIIGGDVEKVLLEMRENQGDANYEGRSQLRGKILLKQYLLNLLCCEPCLFFELCKSAPHETRQELLKFLIMNTITNSYFPVSIIDAAFGALDRMLTEPNTMKIIQQTLALDKSQFNKLSLVDGVFENIKALPFVARHCSLLISLNYGEQQWTKALLTKFYQLSIQQGRNLYHMNTYFASSYYQLLSGVLSQVNMKEDSQISFIKPYINLSFIINSLQYYLKFDLHRADYVNIAVCEQNPSKIESFIECLRLYNIILLNQLKIDNINSEESTTIGLPFSRKQSLLLTPYEAKKFGIQDEEYYLQVKSLRNVTTSYINALSFILLASSDEQKRFLKQINHSYEDLIFQTIEAIAKLNGKAKLKDHFYVKSTHQTQIPTNLNQWKLDDDLCLKKFISYVQSTLNISGIQTILFADLIPNPQKLRTLIDSLRTKMENPKVSERTSPKLVLKAISTLSRYFRDFMARMSLKKDREVNFDRLEIRDHIEFLLQTIVKFVVSLKSNRKSWEVEIVNKILSNVYGGILIVQRLKGSQFLRFLKNYHPLLLNSINMSYLENTYSVNKVEFSRSTEFGLSEEYFRLLEMFLNCEEYLSERQFKIISGIKGLPQKVQSFIISIANYTQFSKLSEQFVDILLQIMISSVGFFIRICAQEQQRRDCLSRCYDIIKEIRQQVKVSANLILLQVLIQNELSQCYSYPQLLMEKQQLLALQMNSVGNDLPIRVLQDIVKKLGKSNLTNLAFLSIANGTFSNIQKSQDSTPLLKHLLDAYNQLLKSPQYATQNLSQSLSYHTLRSTQNIASKLNTNSPYKKVWILQLILAILTNIQTAPTSQKIINLKRLQTLIIQNDSLLKRFGYLMKKNAFQQSQTYFPWLNFLQEQIGIQLTNKNQITYVQKLELYQIIKIFSFYFANTNWKQVSIEKNVDLIWILVQYRQIFQKQLNSGKRNKTESAQQKVLEGISINSFLSGNEMLTSGFKQYNRQKISGDVLKSENCFDLLHEVLNMNLSIQYALMCASIGIPFCQGLSRRVPQMGDMSKWNTLFLEFSQVFTQKYIQIQTNAPLLENILNSFEKIYSGNSQYNISLSKQMLFTNAPSLSCSLEVSYDCWKQALVETLKLLFEHILMINKKLQAELHSDFKAHQQWFTKIITSLKKHDKQNFNYALYDRSEHKTKMSQTIKSNVTIMHSQANPAYSGTTRNY